MRSLFHIFWLSLAFLLPCLGADSPVQMHIVCLDPQANGPTLRAGLKFQIQPGWHIYSDNPGDVGAPPEIVWELPEGWQAGPLQFSTPQRFKTFGIASYGYEGTVYLPVAFTLSPEAQRTPNQIIRAKANVLTCAQECMPVSLSAQLAFPQTPSETDLNGLMQAWESVSSLSNETVSQNKPTSWLWLFFSAILGGLILNVMPCVFPVIGLKVMGFVQKAGADPKQAWKQGLVFSLGVLVSLWILDGLLLALRAGGAQLGWGFQLQSPGFTYLLVVLFFVFGLNMMGVFEVGERATGVGHALMAKEGFWGTFFSGVLAVVVATPCSAPFFAPVIGAALALPALGSLALFTGVGIGLSLPYFILCACPALLKKMPPPGPWMATLRQIFGFLFFATTAYLVWVLAGLTADNEWALLSLLSALVLLGAAAWAYGKWHALSNGKQARLKTAAATMLFLLACWLGWPTKNTHDASFQWEPYSAQKLEALRRENRPVWVDFTARWCVTCLSNKALLNASPQLHRLVREKNVALLKADWTNRNETITRELAKFGRASVPFNLLYLPGEKEPIELPTLLTPDDLIEPLSKIH